MNAEKDSNVLLNVTKNMKQIQWVYLNNFINVSCIIEQNTYILCRVIFAY